MWDRMALVFQDAAMLSNDRHGRLLELVNLKRNGSIGSIPQILQLICLTRLWLVLELSEARLGLHGNIKHDSSTESALPQLSQLRHATIGGTLH